MNRVTRPRADAGGPWLRSVSGVVCAGAILLGGLGLAGCTASLGGELVYGYPVYEVEEVPAEITTYPRYVYHDGYAYLVDDRWYYWGPGGWVVFREEPRELHRYRVSLPPERRVRRPLPPPPRPRPVAPREENRRYYPR